VKHIELIGNFFKSRPGLPSGAEERIVSYLSLLIKERSIRKITASADPLVLAEEHIIPSMELGLNITGKNHADIGSGCGFPAIPSAIVRPDINFTLMEPMMSRKTFLQSLILKLQIENARLLQMRAEDAGRNALYREKFDSATARAVLPLAGSAELTLPLLKIGGRFYAQPGASAAKQIESAEEKIKDLGGAAAWKGGDLVIINKSARTPDRFPRSWKRIQKSARG